ncbi:MAG: caspase family protein [Alistipes sp.]|nr:caspase family protein [Alistipes sp.]MBP3456421.1 caspase family protein [Alistipes sp.]
MTWLRAALAAAAMLLVSLSAAAKVYLVSVGITDYPGTDSDLALPAKDARTITWVYSKNSGLQYCMLLDSNATVAHIKSAMNRVFSAAGADDIVVFFYSGHGYPGGFCAYDGDLSYTDIRKAMARSRCKNKMIFADACYAGKMRTDVSSMNSQSEQSAARKANVMLFLSSRSNECSIESPGMANGFFTTYLQKGLRGGADKNKDRIITARELFDYVHRNVVELSGGAQHPVMWGKFSDNMPVMKWKK